MRSRFCLELLSRKPSWPAFMCERTKRPDIWTQAILIKALQNTLQGEGRPHMKNSRLGEIIVDLDAVQEAIALGLHGDDEGRGVVFYAFDLQKTVVFA
jgi:hypothetical protein